MPRRPSLVIFTRKYVNLPAVLASRMQRYSIYLLIMAFVLLGLNLHVLTRETAVWFVAGLVAVFAILCGIATTVLDAIAWNFEHLREELDTERTSVGVQ